MPVDWPGDPSENEVVYDSQLNFPYNPTAGNNQLSNGIVNIDISLKGLTTLYGGSFGYNVREGALWLYCFGYPASGFVNLESIQGQLYFTDK